MKRDIQLYKKVGVLLVLTSLGSCGASKYTQPELDLPTNFRTGEDVGFVQDSTHNSIAQIPYSEFFKDPVLVSLIEEGILNNNDLKVALKQIEIASLGFTQSKWNNVPTVNLNAGTASINRPSDNSMNGMSMGQSLGQSYVEDYNTSLNISWEADIWGKIKGKKEIALAQFLQTQEGTKAVQTQVVTQIAQGYYNLLMLDMQLDITNKNLELIDKTLHMLMKQHELGIGTSLSVVQQENTRDQILATIPALEQAVLIQENALSVLTGRMPSAIERNATLTNTQTPEYKSVGIPSEMLQFRPDVKRSELLVNQAFANVKVAKKSMYPSLNITAQGGVNSMEFKDWFNIPGSLFGMAAGSIAVPILNGKQLKTQFKQAEIAMEQAEITFKQTVLQAVGEVSNVMATIESADKQENITNGLVTRSQEAVDTSTKLFQNDMATYLDVIMAQNNKLQAELNLATIKFQKLNAVVNLYRSLGGGWN